MNFQDQKMSKKGKICNYLEYKSVFSRAFFSRYEKLNLSKNEIDEFWSFCQKYLDTKKKSQQKTGDTNKIELQFLKKYDNSIPNEWKDVDVLATKLRGFDKYEITEFRKIILMFIDFNNKRKEKKMIKMKKFQENLPIYKYQEAIIEAIKSYSVLLIAGDTGCGKSTQIPQYLLKANYEKICCTQPRRIACISLRNRLAQETMDKYASEIGYQIRFERLKSQHTKVLFLTEGLLLRQMIEDPLLSSYNVIILDEIHERHLSCDFLLGAIKCLLNKRKSDIKIILMSATVNCDLFSSYFGNCPVIKVPGRLFPIKTEYFPVNKFNLLKSNSSKISPEPYLKILQHIDDKYSSSERGDVLIFLCGFLEIETVGEVLKTYAEQTEKWIILYLHSSLSIAEQDKVFGFPPDGARKCILSTNIAETSLTIDGIRFVIDSGKVKEMNYDPKIRMHKLQEIWVSKASAEQRKGRAGRTGPGVCFRLYSTDEFEQFSNFSTPEIKRVSLESLILNMISMGLRDVRKFPFLEPPELSCIESNLKCLIDYGTLNKDETITVIGSILSKLPVDIPIGKMLILSTGYDLSDFMLSSAACLNVHTLVTNRSINDCDAIEKRKQLFSIEGDIFTFVRFYSQWLMLKVENKNSRLWCKALGLEEQRFHEMTKLRNQFKEILTESKLLQPSDSTSNSAMSKSERTRKHGETKLYKQLKRDRDNLKNKKRRVLSLTSDQDFQENDNVDCNIKDMEFKLQFDLKQLMGIKNQHEIDKENIEFVKLILCMSFYPQLAIADPDNSYRTDTDQIFHTKDKPFVVLHPSSVYYNQPEAMQSKDVNHSLLGALSSSHQLIGYISLIETSKTYISNCYRISAIHALLLCAREVDTNEDFSRIICDSWIELQCLNTEDCQEIIIQAIKIKREWSRFLQKVFDELSQNESDDKPSNCYFEEVQTLKSKTRRYCNMRFKYTIKRLMPADLKFLYNRSAMNADINRSMKSYPKLIDYLIKDESIKPIANNKKGGLQLLHINFNCLKRNEQDEVVKSTLKLFNCPHCNKEMYFSVIEKARHEEKCCTIKAQQSDKTNQTAVADKSKETCHLSKREKDSSGRMDYYCDNCGQNYSFNSIEILKHRRGHSQ